MVRKLRISILAAFLLLVFTASQALAAPSIRFTLNGARQAYGPGSVFMLYGRAEDSGFGLPYSDVLVQVNSGDKPILYSQTKADGDGYFRTNFNFPYSSLGSTFQVMTSTPESLLKEDYQLTAKTGLSFNCMGFRDKITNQRVPLDTKEILLVFTSNVNYFYNKDTDSDLKVLGRNDKNADCVRVYAKDSGKLVSTSAKLIFDDFEGDQMNTFYMLDGTQKSETKKRTLVVALNEKLAGNTTYKVVINREMAANNSAILGQEKVIEFTTEAAASSTKTTTPVTGQSINTSGGTISEAGVTIVVPPNALSSDIKVTVEKILNTSTLPINANSQFVGDVVEIIKDRLGDFSTPVTISLSFDKSKVDTSKYDLQICYLDEKENKWIPLDHITVDPKTGTVSGQTKHFTKFAVIAIEKGKGEVKEEVKEEEPVPVGPGKVINLRDIKGHWAEKTITELVASGAIGGYPDGTFKPDQGISRAEFATIVIKAFQLPEKQGKVFEDTANHWAKNFIATASAYGIVNGYSDTKFGPNDPITREQMAVMIVKAAKLAEIQGGKTFADSGKVSAWAKNAVATASEKNIIGGYPDNSFRPQKGATRAEAATVIVKALKLAS